MIQSRVHVSDLREHVGRTVTVFGWVNTLRLQSKMQFVVVRDGTGLCR
jgi:aspartyl-tRNA synthetase